MRQPDKSDETIGLAAEFAEWTDDPGNVEIVRFCQARLALLRGDLDSAVRSTKTVKTHLKNIYHKLKVGNSREAVAKASSLGILWGGGGSL
jgi:hypothetical protein